MPDNKQQVPLNDVFYGPSIPSITRRHARHNHHNNHHNRSCLCGLLCFLFKIILSLVLILALAILIFWLIFRPTGNLKFHVTDASLTEFTFSESNNVNTLKYNLVVNLTVHNPNKRVGVHYKSLKALAYYEGQRFGNYLALTELDQGQNDTSVWRLVFSGQSIVALDKSDDERLAGVFSIDIRVSLRYKLRFGKLTTSTMKPKIACDLKVPLNDKNGFQTTKCKASM